MIIRGVALNPVRPYGFDGPGDRPSHGPPQDMAKFPKLTILAVKTQHDGRGIVNRIPEEGRRGDKAERDVQQKTKRKRASWAATLKP